MMLYFLLFPSRCLLGNVGENVFFEGVNSGCQEGSKPGLQEQATRHMPWD